MEQILNLILPLIIIAGLSGVYIWFLHSKQGKGTSATINDNKNNAVKSNKAITLISYMDYKATEFYNALKQALPSNFIIYPNVAVEKLLDTTSRLGLQLQGQYADFVVFSPSRMPILIIDLFDMSIINLDEVNKVKRITKTIMKNSGVPVLDLKYSDTYNIDELRQIIANILNPLRVDTNK